MKPRLVPIPCKFCGNPRRVSVQAHAENPFCNQCHHRRVKLANSKLPQHRVEFEEKGGYITTRAELDELVNTNPEKT